MRKDGPIKIDVVGPDTGGTVTVIFGSSIPKSIAESAGKYIFSLLSSHVLYRKEVRGEREIYGTGFGEFDSFSSIFDEFKFLLVKHFQYGFFNSRNVQDEFDRVLGERLRGGSVSTYLLRLSDSVNGIAERQLGVEGYEDRPRSEKVKGFAVQAEETPSFLGVLLSDDSQLFKH